MKVLYATISALLLLASANVQAITITIAPDAPTVSNCFPFGGDSDPGDDFSPYMGFVYKNVPAFSMAPGDTIAFDTANIENDVAIELDIELAATTVNGGNVASGGFTRVVSNTQQASDPNGNEVLGDYELAFTAEDSFDFPGGGLIIRFSNESAAYAADNDCTQNLVWGAGSDTSDFFVERFYYDVDGLAPYEVSEASRVGAFQLIVGEYVAPDLVPVPTLGIPALLLMVLSMAALAATQLRSRLF